MRGQDDRGYLDFAQTHLKHKKKKRCLDPAHTQDFPFAFGVNTSKLGGNYFRTFESVDSHIESLVIDKKLCLCSQKIVSPTRNTIKVSIPNTFAPTLPTASMDYSPCVKRCLNNGSTIPRSKAARLNLDQFYPQNKRPKIDHVNDFLHQISFITSPEDDRLILPKIDVPVSTIPTPRPEPVKVSPLVQRLVDLRFSKISYNDRKCEEEANANDSSFINELSLDKIVDAILDSSPEPETKESSNVGQREKENHLNETHEENLRNTENEKAFDKMSYDSGFRSTSTENSHHIDSNYVCKCNNNKNPKSTCDNPIISEERTIIDIGCTFNERCVDEYLNVNVRKRSSSTPEECDIQAKRPNTTCSSGDLVENSNFTLKRQKCIRRRRTTTASENRTKKPQRESFGSENPNDSFVDSWECSGKIGEGNVSQSTPIRDDEELNSKDDMPAENFKNIRKTRRCLTFESPKNDGKSENERTFLSKTDECAVRGVLDLNVRFQNDQLTVHGKLTKYYF